MNLRYASVILLLSSAMIAGWFITRSVPSGVSTDARLQVVVPVPPLKAVLDAFIDPAHVQVESLMDGQADVHHVHLSPSQLRRLEMADIAMTDMGAGDPHMWMSLAGLHAFVSEVAAKLDEASRLQGNAFLVGRANWVSHQQARFASLQSTPFIVDHDAFQGFEEDLGLTGKLGALTTGHDQAIGAKSLRALRAKAAGKNVCVLQGPHANTKRLATLLEGATLRFTEADPLLWNDPSYASGMQRLADAFYACLTEAQSTETTR